jgi:four helix bundle protein
VLGKTVVVNSFRDLRVWQAAMHLVSEIYCLTQLFPKHETYGLASQIQRAAVSIPSNIAEGHAREHIKEYLHHLSMAQGSLAELETQLEIASRLNYISSDQLSQSMASTASLGRQLYALRNSLIRIKLAPGPRYPAPAL